MSNDVYLAKIRQNLNSGGVVVGEVSVSGGDKGVTGTNKSDFIVYRRPGGGSGIGVCKKTSEMDMHSRIENTGVGGGGGGVVKGSNNFDSIESGNREAMQNFNEHGYIFGSTSPRGMSTSDYIGGGGGVGGIDTGTGSRSLQKDSNESDNNISSCSTLDICKKIDNLSVNDLEIQIRELSQRLQKSEKERDEFKRKLDEVSEEKDSCFRRLEVVSSAHESRITEMHCVIAELSKKWRNKQENTILEENEIEGSEISYQEGSIYNSELNLTNPDAECQTDPLEPDYSLDEPKILNEIVVKSQVEALQEEVLHLRGEIALLQSQIASNRQCSSPDAQQIDTAPDHDSNDDLDYDDNDEDDNSLSNEKKLNCFYDNDNDYYKTDDDDEIGKKDFYIDSLDDNNLCVNSAIKQTTKKYIDRGNCLETKENYHCHVKNSTTEVPVPKMAERVKLRRTVEDQHITGTDIRNTGINNSEIVEHLVSDLMQSNSMMDSFIEPSQLDTEFQRLQRRIEKLKLRNSVLSLTLNECKEHCDHLYLLCGKYESNAIALQSALNCSDRAIEAYDVMLALLESKLAILKENSPAAEESRRAVESVARHLLDRLESEKNVSENSLGPWQNTFCISDKPFEPWTAEDDNRLRNHVSKLKGRRSAVQNTAVSLESPFSSLYEKARLAFENNTEMKPENTKMDLEMAVLMQELMSLRDEVVDSKRKREEAERDRQFAIEKICILQEALQQLQTQLTDSDALFNLTTRDRSSFSEADHAALTEQQLVEALTRESELKIRIQSLIGSVSASRKSSDEKYAQVQSNIKELQKMNLNLSQSMEQNKRKYQSKIKRLEQKILDLSMELGQQQQQQQHHHSHQHQCGLSSHDNVPETTL